MTPHIDTQVCVVGGGPGGLMLGLELARRGCDVVVVEQSTKFTRHFRGESVSPDSVRLLDQRGLLEEISARLDFEETRRFEISDGGRRVLEVDFRDLSPTGYLPIELPQQILLDVLAEAAARHPGFTLLRGSSATGLVEEGGRVVGVRCGGGQDGGTQIRAALTVGADGRFSRVLRQSGLAHKKTPLNRDVLWCTLPFPDTWDRSTVRVRIDGDQHALCLPTHPGLVRVGLNIPKGGLKEFRGLGINALRSRLSSLVPELAPAAAEHITGWNSMMLLDIFTTSVPQWSRPGLVLIGDAAHTLSPVLGQGVNHAVIDAVTLAPLVARALRSSDRSGLLDAATQRFQHLRSPHVEQARKVQLAQERAFSVSSAPAVRVRQGLYTLIDSNDWLKRRVWRRVYYTLPAGRRHDSPIPRHSTPL
ncbi:FAD-dependent monooxygenase [Streptomyces sp. MK7]|uniref:FAD-dependent monooxygenase n=1 Tax=Streptomyces sp. MK7 TaxID=3067635 RepID=UPI00292D5D60|nr:FAD-dependent monooxygenase [Streptomyces sp. MK7]